MMHGCEIITLTRIVENDAKCVSVSRPDTAHAVSQIHTVHAIVAVDRAITNREHNAVSLSKRHNHRSGLHTRPLFRHNKFTAGKIFRAFRQQDCELKREHMVAVQAWNDRIALRVEVLRNLVPGYLTHSFSNRIGPES
jgi:hypothetical protein